MPIKFEKATKEKALLRAAIYGPAGAGKTMTSLRVAKGMVESKWAPEGARIALIDTEFRSASKYADRFDFDVLEMPTPTVDAAIEAIAAASEAGYFVLVFDSITHVWHELLLEVDRLAMARYRGNRHSAWAEGTPKQKRFSRAIHSCACHLIATMREKTVWEIEDRDGKKTPVRLGVGPEQGKGLEYEFDVIMNIDVNHIGTIQKDRTGKFQDLIIERPDERWGDELIAWLNDGVERRPIEIPPVEFVESKVRRAQAVKERVAESPDVTPTVVTKRLFVHSCGRDGELFRIIVGDGSKERSYVAKSDEVATAAAAAAERGGFHFVTFETRPGSGTVIAAIEPELPATE